MRKPNFFIVGAPKSGTTAMYRYLKDHPDVFMPERKEAHFFGSDMRSPLFVDSLDRYLERFEPAQQQKRIGEAAIWYLMSECAAAEIKAFDPQAKIIAMLRNPADMIYSYHSQRLYNGNEDVEDFAQALRLEPQRQNGEHLPADPHPVHGLIYHDIPKYYRQVERYFDVFGRENVKVILFDEFSADTAAVFSDTLDFLGVDNRYTPTFRVVNPNRRIRSGRLKKFIYHPPQALIRLARLLFPKHLRRKLVKGLVDVNTKPVKRKEMSLALRAELNDYYREDVRALGKLLDKDLLSLWLGDADKRGRNHAG